MVEETKKKYRFERSDFGPLSFAPLHYDLVFDILPKRVRVVARQTYLYTKDEPTKELVLDSHDLEVESVSQFETHSLLGPPPVGIDAQIPDFVQHVSSLKDPVPLKFNLDNPKRKLTVQLEKEVSKGQEIVIQTISKCFPNDSVLEGIYYDYTPENAPQTMITQCQQYGFQRIVPCIDEMISKTFYTTTIVAAKAYTNIVSNGDLAPGFYSEEDNKPVYQEIDAYFGESKAIFVEEQKQGDDVPDRHVIKYHNHKVNMAPYLFFLGVGTYDVYRRQVEYPDDGSTFDIELLCFPNIVKPEHALKSLSALHDSILWVYVSCGPEAVQHEEERAQVYQLLERREQLKASHQSDSASEAELQRVRQQLAQLMSAWKETGYKYTGKCYREIAMENSNYGGMENVGNTTIISSRLTPSDWLVDGGYIYMEGVKVHEYYHNINGSQVTGASPFEIWLNEAVTVHIQREREAVLFGHAFMRLREVQYAFMPMSGPLAQDRSPTSMAVEPVGFNTTHELISAMTYSKAPEFVRMVELLLGKAKFVRALENYHRKYAFSNATTGDWITEMAAEGDHLSVDLHQMARGWLNRTGYPTVRVTHYHYDESKQQVVATFEQSGYEKHPEDERYPWVVPIDWALVREGANTSTGLFVLKDQQATLTIDQVTSKPDFISVARDWSFYGNVTYAPEAFTPEQTKLQALYDPDPVNRYLATQIVIDNEKAHIIRNLLAHQPVSVSEDFLELYGTIFNDSRLSDATKASLLTISESINDHPSLGHYYVELATARTTLLSAVFAKYAETVFNAYQRLLSDIQSNPDPFGSIGERTFLFHCYNVLDAGLDKAPDASRAGVPDSVKSFDLLASLKPLLQAASMSMKLFALKSIMQLDRIDESERNSIQQQAMEQWVKHPIGCEQYVSCIANLDSPNSPKYIAALIEAPFFQMSLSGHARAVARGWASNRKRSLLTEEGLKFTKELFLKVGKVNQMSAYSFLDAFADLHKFAPDVQQTLTAALRDMQQALDPQQQESLYNQLNILLSSE